MQQALPPSKSPHHARRWLILVAIGIAQLMVVLDVTIVKSRFRRPKWTWASPTSRASG
jgi:hypothetical protein